MLSIPPAITTLVSPSRKPSAASITAFMPEPHTLLTVVQGMLSGRPPSAPPDGRGLANPGTQHVAQIGFIDLLSLSPFCHGRSNGTGPSSGAVRLARGPWKAPMGYVWPQQSRYPSIALSLLH